ncbi:family 16 glycoside hydrolase [Maribacter sp. HTCC2170]|uniref:family 16 glycoside hydrolase n=1 Tax=Maribacter sp. (strain HTCC2170 / KCCM 42371) TaxID=313603 RepID=UPI00006B21A3|nr:family 16 glycoside hydrolase [Maribacter sp. HTCC2170]EAR00063.1 hypothetical protein FB2170_00315 [Maribacter sp. HTCC2170]
MKRFIPRIFAILIIILLTQSQAFSQSTKLALNEELWLATETTKVSFETFDGREAVMLEGDLGLKNSNYIEGVMTMDVYCTSKRSFAGMFFHKSDGNKDEIYLRQHKSNQVDAIQYTPVFNNEGNWQLYHKFQAKANFKLNEWNNLKVEFNKTQANVYVNDELLLTINDLQGVSESGEIGLWSLFPSWISNVSFEETKVDIENDLAIEPKLNSNYITKWQLSESYSFESLNAILDESKNLAFKNVTADNSGLLPISKYVTKKSAGNFERNAEDIVVAQFKVSSEIKEIKKMYFDYSDRCIVLLNGNELFSGNNSFRLKGPQFMGHLNPDANALNLNLMKGENTVQIILIEKANGWGLSAKFEDLERIQLH